MKCMQEVLILPIDLYQSDATKFQIVADGIRPPLNSLQGLAAAAQNIVEARNEGSLFLLMIWG